MALPKKSLRERIQNVDVNSEESVDTLIKWILDGASASRDAIQEKLDEAEAKIAEFEKAATTKDADLTTIKADFDKLTAEYETLKASSGDAQKVQAEFDAYKTEIAEKETKAAKTAAVRKALKSAGVGRDSFIDLLADKVDLASVEVENGAVKNAAFVDSLKASYAECFTTQQSDGVPAVTPAASGSKGTGMTLQDIAAIKDRDERQAAIAANPQLFAK